MNIRRLRGLLLPLVAGAAVFAWMKLSAPGAAARALEPVARPVRALRLAPIPVVPRALGYGTARPGRTWRAVARVEGRIVALHADLRPGLRVAAGAVLFAVDRAPYELARASAEADLARTDAELEELAVREENDRAALAIEESALALAEADLARFEILRDEGTVSEAELDASRRSVLTARQAVQTLRGSVARIPAQRKTLAAARAAQEVALANAELDLSYTSVLAPFDGVLGALDVEEGQFVARGETLFELLGSDRAEIDAEFLYGEARHLVGPRAGELLATAGRRDAEVERQLAAFFSAEVRMRSGDLDAAWDARIVGVREDVEAATRAIRLTVVVDGPYERAVPGVRPPLLKGTFCEVELRGERLTDRLVVPRAALRGGTVATLDTANKLVRRPVEVAFVQGDMAVLAAGLAAGDWVLVGDSEAFAEGTWIVPIVDAALAAELTAEAAGEAPLR